MAVTDLSEMEKDALGEVMNISMGSAATAVSELLSAKVWITTPTEQKNASPKAVTQRARCSVSPRQPSMKLCIRPRFLRRRPPVGTTAHAARSEEHTSELQSQ